jgi:hypothetical protein
MFDHVHSKTLKTFRFAPDIELQISLIDEDPGHVQSGMYLWPAAEHTCRFLVKNWGILTPINRALELGSGCGLTGDVTFFNL